MEGGGLVGLGDEVFVGVVDFVEVLSACCCLVASVTGEDFCVRILIGFGE